MLRRWAIIAALLLAVWAVIRLGIEWQAGRPAEWWEWPLLGALAIVHGFLLASAPMWRQR